MDCFEIRNLSFAYPEQTKKALDEISFSIGQGEFIVLAGPSGCGKTTLLRQLKPILAPHGEKSGEIFFEGRALKDLDKREQSSRIGFVLQNPDSQIVTDKVWHELAFGLESLGFDTPTIRGRVAEMANFFGIQTWFYKDVSELSGGQKQLINLASIMAMQPSVLILDEPTSQLDPIAAADFLATVGRINRELGTTVIITEHRLEEVFPMSDRVIVLDKGKLLCEGATREVGEKLKESGHSMFLSMPAPMRIYAAVPNDLPCPVTVRDGRLWLEELAETHTLNDIQRETLTENNVVEAYETPTIELCNLWFKYEKDQPDVIKGLSLKASKGGLLAVLGGNGTGKTTALSLISGIIKPYRGKVLLEGKELSQHGDGVFSGLLGVLPQNPQALFLKKTVYEDLLSVLDNSGLPKEQIEKRLINVAQLCRLTELLCRHPYDLSGGEQQRAALAKVLLPEPRILLLDEPTKGLDAEFKQVFAEILERLLNRGVTVIMVSHDIEFCAKYAHRCAMFFDGRIVTEDTPRKFFSGNSFYTTSANRMARSLLPEAITAEDVILSCGGEIPLSPSLPDEDEEVPELNYLPMENKENKLPPWRKALAWTAGAIIFIAAFLALTEPNIPWLMNNRHMGLYIVLILAFIALALAVTGKDDGKAKSLRAREAKRKLSKRTVLALVMMLLAVPLTIYVGIYYFGDRKYYFISLLIILEMLLPFELVFEGRKPQARELIIISVLCALGVAGRAAFFMLPEFKPVAALVIISGVAFGGETGFMVGAVTMLVSNIMFGQGPWTPWQMLAMGSIGFISGILLQRGRLSVSRLPLCIFGGLATLIIYGGLMNPASVLMYYNAPTWPMFLTAYILGFPFDLIHAIATVIFLWLISQPMLEKLERIKLKYGMLE